MIKCRLEKTEIIKDDKCKNGIKPYMWGKIYWYNKETIAKYIQNFDDEQFKAFAKFFMTSPKDIIPCLNCRKNFRIKLSLPEYDIEIFLGTHCLAEFVYSIHNNVNSKTEKEIEPSLEHVYCLDLDDIKNCLTTEDYYSLKEEKNLGYTEKKSGYTEKKSGYTEKKSGYNEELFWQWIKFIAFGYPSDIQLTEYYFAQDDDDDSTVSCYYKDSKEEKEMQSRMKTYILFFDLIKNFIPRNSPLIGKWIKSYVKYTPTPFTFANRTQLLSWVFKMEKECNAENIDINDKSMVVMLEELHPCRSTF